LSKKKSDSDDFLDQARRIMNGEVRFLPEATTNVIETVGEVKVEQEPPKREPPKPEPPKVVAPNPEPPKVETRRAAPAASKRREPEVEREEAVEEDEESEEGSEGEEAEAHYVVPDDEGLAIGDDLVMPVAMIGETIGIVAQKGAGKTHTTVVFAEECLQQELPVVIIDPLGVYWGLRSSKDGESPGVTIRILGGDFGDLPLDPGSGRAVARWVVQYKKSVILDIKLMRKSEQRMFVAEFGEELYDKNKSAMHLIMDESDLFMPQRPEPEQKRVLLAFEDIVRRGRVRGIGITVVTQRPAVLHKDILTQVGTLIVLRMMGPQDKDAIKEWISSHDDPYKQRIALNSLPGLPKGTAWVWSPGFLGIFQKVAIRDRLTFDSSATPTAGAPPPPMPRVRTEIDIEALRLELGDAVKNDPDDPKNQRLRIAELERIIETRGGEEGSSIVLKLRRRVDELEKQLIARAGRGKGAPMTVSTTDLATVILESRAMTESNKILTDQVMELCERFDQAITMLNASAAGNEEAEEGEPEEGEEDGAIQVYRDPDDDDDDDDDEEDEEEVEEEEEPPPPPPPKRRSGRKH